MRAILLVSVGVVLAMSAGAQASYITVGTGSNTANLVIEFGDSAVYAFSVKFSDPNTTGSDLLSIVEAASTLEVNRTYYEGWGDYVWGMTFDGHSNVGNGSGADWWHYWVRDGSSAEWNSPWDYGASFRTVSNGYSDGWVYGRDDAPRLPGDANNDLKVSTGDLALLAGNWGTQSGATWAGGDFNGDGAVTTGDLSLLAGNWGFGVEVGPAPSMDSTAVPEPASLTLLACAGLACLRRRNV
ncbi:MAG: dockerin type I domain-containing protein [Phycisphaerae bacterium]|jgi:hypothetical protein